MRFEQYCSSNFKLFDFTTEDIVRAGGS